MQTKKQRQGFRHFEAGNKLFGQARFAEAAQHFERALARDPENPTLMFYLGACHCSMSDNRKGLSLLRRALAIDPTDANRWWNTGSFLYFAGEMEEAGRAMLRAIEMMPGQVNPLYNYVNIMRPTPDHPVVQRIREMIDTGRLEARGLSYAYYALATAHEAAKDYPAAFDWALKGGEAYGVQCNLDDRNVERIIRANTRAALTREPRGGDPSEAPVFIVGMPRSGTTFTETMLSRHPGVLAAGELSGARTAELLAISWASQNAAVSNAFEAVRVIPPQVEEVAASYLMAQVSNLSHGRPFARFIDKLPENVFRLGLISRMFPNARIIVIHRHPLDNCVSCLFQRFNDVQYSYTNTIPTLATQYRAFQRVLAHWREVLPLPMLELNYQQLVGDFEGQSRRIVDFLGLPWDDACLDTASSGRTVKTASARQIREGVNTKSIDRWKRYGPGIEPLIEALGGMDQIEEWAQAGMVEDAAEAERLPA
jgi:hypothetical protein